ncbi:MAG TPA: FAD:protein FMN transferase, partial [Actinoplanes sp.]|nr:FAD:protein FMN transferase [Actinoplanes sp.]
MTAPSRSDRAVTFKAMATTVTLRLLGAGPGAQAVLERAARVFARVEAACTRFDPQSPLMRANADGTGWHRVPSECYLAIEEAARAHRETGGLFDPRVLDVLVSMGYDRTLPFAAGPVSVTGTAAAVAVPLTPWSPGLDPANRAVRLGPARIDLGGIG